MSFFASFENKHGKIDMGGAGYVIRVTEIDGLEPVEAQTQQLKLIGKPGISTASLHQEPRYITITGRVKGDINETRYHTQLMAKVFDNITAGVFSINVYGRLRKIDCISESLSFIIVKENHVNFVVTLRADNPYFYEWSEQVFPLFKIEDNLFDGMEFPREFSYMYAGGNVLNESDVDLEPLITIEAGEPGDPPVYGLIITNITTGAMIELRYNPVKDEIITIDIEKRVITSNFNGIITRYINPYTTVLSDFVLKPGNNEITFENLNDTQPLLANITYKNIYGEAVY